MAAAEGFGAKENFRSARRRKGITTERRKGQVRRRDDDGYDEGPAGA